MQKASKSCSGGEYRVISSESHAGGAVADVFPGPVTWYSITYKCGKFNGKMPSFPFQGQRYTRPSVIINNNTGTTSNGGFAGGFANGLNKSI